LVLHNHYQNIFERQYSITSYKRIKNNKSLHTTGLQDKHTADGQFLQHGKLGDTKKRMAMAEQRNPYPELPSNYRIEGNGKIYLSPESERITNLRLASGQGFRIAIGNQHVNHVDIKPKEQSYYDYFNNNNKAKGLETLIFHSCLELQHIH
jgi:hypothetical protein